MSRVDTGEGEGRSIKLSDVHHIIPSLMSTHAEKSLSHQV